MPRLRSMLARWVCLRAVRKTCSPPKTSKSSSYADSTRRRYTSTSCACVNRCAREHPDVVLNSAGEPQEHFASLATTYYDSLGGKVVGISWLQPAWTPQRGRSGLKLQMFSDAFLVRAHDRWPSAAAPLGRSLTIAISAGAVVGERYGEHRCPPYASHPQHVRVRP